MEEYNSEEYNSWEEEQEVLFASFSMEARNQRNRLLTACDWTQVADVGLTEEKKLEWQNYRQALREITSAEGFPFTHEWPVQPS